MKGRQFCGISYVQADFPIGVDVGVEAASSSIGCCSSHGWCFGGVIYARSLSYNPAKLTTDIPLLNLTANCTFCQYAVSNSHRKGPVTSKNPNSYGVSGGPMIIAFTFLTSTSRQATAMAGNTLLVENIIGEISLVDIWRFAYIDLNPSGCH